MSSGNRCRWFIYRCPIEVFRFLLENKCISAEWFYDESKDKSLVYLLSEDKFSVLCDTRVIRDVFRWEFANSSDPMLWVKSLSVGQCEALREKKIFDKAFLESLKESDPEKVDRFIEELKKVGRGAIFTES